MAELELKQTPVIDNAGGTCLPTALESFPLVSSKNMLDEPIVLVEIPPDLARLKQESMEQALAARMELRCVLEEYLNARGYTAVSVLSDSSAAGRRSVYVLQR